MCHQVCFHCTLSHVESKLNYFIKTISVVLAQLIGQVCRVVLGFYLLLLVLVSVLGWRQKPGQIKPKLFAWSRSHQKTVKNYTSQSWWSVCWENDASPALTSTRHPSLPINPQFTPSPPPLGPSTPAGGWWWACWATDMGWDNLHLEPQTGPPFNFHWSQWGAGERTKTSHLSQL